MILFDALVWLAIAKVVVLLFEDASFAARGRKSPRLQAREAREQRRAGGAAPASGTRHRVGGAIGGYFAGVVEDAAASAQANRRRRAARRHGRRAVDGVLVDLDEHDRAWYADCGLCDWSSPGFRLESRAQLAGAEHAKTHQTHADEQEVNQNEPPAGPRAWQPRVIPGGAAGGAARIPSQKSAQDVDDDDPEPSSVVHDGPSPYELRGDGKPRYGWVCNTCGTRAEGYATLAAAQRVGGQHTCPPQSTGGAPAGIGPAESATTTENTNQQCTTDTKENTVNLEATGPEEIRAAFQTAIETATERAEEIAGIAAVLTEAADRYESLEMAPSTVAHIKDAADQVSAAESSLTSAAEELEAALADFNARDGQVAETVADAGNLASKDVLVG
jgi:hypothetical protein